MTASDPRVGEIQARSDDALLHESLNPSDYAELAWASARDVPYLLAELADRDDVITKLSEWAGRSKSAYYDEAQDDVVKIIRPILRARAAAVRGEG